jgi:hypothetical protein
MVENSLGEHFLRLRDIGSSLPVKEFCTFSCEHITQLEAGASSTGEHGKAKPRKA